MNFVISLLITNVFLTKIQHYCGRRYVVCARTRASCFQHAYTCIYRINFFGVNFSRNDDYNVKVFAGLIFEDRRATLTTGHTPTILTTPPAGLASDMTRDLEKTLSLRATVCERVRVASYRRSPNKSSGERHDFLANEVVKYHAPPGRA